MDETVRLLVLLVIGFILFVLLPVLFSGRCDRH
jgi:hypothetical protein